MGRFNEKLRALRKEHNMTQDELADKLGISRSAVGMYEQGRREPDFDKLKVLADYFSVSSDVLLESEEDRRARQEERLAAYAAAFQAAEDKMREEEQAVIKAYRTASEDTKKAVRAVLGIEI
jgi:transcriptional regulator with XRE-family HTH domain